MYSKLPYPSIFLENENGAFLVENTPMGKTFIEINKDGRVFLFYGLLPNELIPGETYSKMIINLEYAESLKNMYDGDSPHSGYDVAMQHLKFSGLLILNALLHINALNCSIEQYKPSRKELSNYVSNVHRELYIYNVVNIFKNKCKPPANIKEVETIASSPMSENIRRHMVRGHFKQRSSGIYWWNPFLRCKKNEGYVEKSYVLK